MVERRVRVSVTADSCSGSVAKVERGAHFGAMRKDNVVTNSAVDLFCGCGGISAGLRQAGLEVLAGIDNEPHFIKTFQRNFPKSLALVESITDLSPARFGDLAGIKPGELEVLAGGPPCQGFSKNVPRKHRYLDDPKNLLVRSFLDYAEYLQPRILIMENVAEMKNGFDGQYTQEVTDRLAACGYTVSHAVLNAADYGVPQRRRRAFFFANNEGVKFSIPQPTHSLRTTEPTLIAGLQHVSVWEAISDLPGLVHGEGKEWAQYSSEAQTPFQQAVRNPDGRVKNHVARRLQPKQYERLASLEPGQGLKDLPKHLQVKGGYSGAYARLTKDMVAPTITRWVFHPGSGRWGHPVDTRLISIREIARIQGFRDSYEFEGSYTQQAGQLGNAVPPMLVEHLVRSLRKQLDGHRAASNSSKSGNVSLSLSEGIEKAIA